MSMVLKVFHKEYLFPFIKELRLKFLVDLFILYVKLMKLKIEKLNGKQLSQMSLQFKLFNLAIVNPFYFFSFLWCRYVAPIRINNLIYLLTEKTNLWNFIEFQELEEFNPHHIWSCAHKFRKKRERAWVCVNFWFHVFYFLFWLLKTHIL